MTPNIEPLYVELGQRIRCAREFAGWTQTDLGQALGMTRAAVANFENGKARVTVHALVAIAACFRVSVDRLLPGQSSKTKKWKAAQ